MELKRWRNQNDFKGIPQRNTENKYKKEVAINFFVFSCLKAVKGVLSFHLILFVVCKVIKDESDVLCWRNFVRFCIKIHDFFTVFDFVYLYLTNAEKQPTNSKEINNMKTDEFSFTAVCTRHANIICIPCTTLKQFKQRNV